MIFFSIFAQLNTHQNIKRKKEKEKEKEKERKKKGILHFDFFSGFIDGG